MPHARSLLVAAEVALVGVLGALLGLLVAGSVRVPVGPFDADLSLRPAVSGSTTVDVPPLGRLELDTHDGPVRLAIGVAALRPEAARRLASNPAALRGLGAAVQSDLRDGVRTLAVRTLVVTVGGATLLGLLVFRRRWRRTAAGAGAGLAVLATVGGVALSSYDERGLAEPRFSGLLASAPAAVGDVRDLLARFDRYELQLGRLVANVSELYATTSTLAVFTPDDTTLKVLHVSDLHLNPAAFELIDSVVQQFGIDVVVDTGDISDWGSAAEQGYVDGIGRLGVPYVWVRGNHDSRLTQAAVAAQPGAVVLDGPEVVEVAGIRFLGAGDPRFTPDKTTRDDQAPAERMLAVGRGLARAAQQSFEPPDVVAVHDPVSARPLRGVAPLVLAGHTHRRDVVEQDGTRLLVQGSTGGAGLRALEGEQPTPVTMTVLYLDPATRQLQAWDDITLGGLGASDARIRRTVAGSVLAEPDPSPSASPAPSPSPAPSASPAPSPSPSPSPSPAPSASPSR